MWKKLDMKDGCHFNGKGGSFRKKATALHFMVELENFGETPGHFGI